MSKRRRKYSMEKSTWWTWGDLEYSSTTLLLVHMRASKPVFLKPQKGCPNAGELFLKKSSVPDDPVDRWPRSWWSRCREPPPSWRTSQSQSSPCSRKWVACLAFLLSFTFSYSCFFNNNLTSPILSLSFFLSVFISNGSQRVCFKIIFIRHEKGFRE